VKLYITEHASLTLRTRPGPIRTPQDLVPVVRDAVGKEMREYFIVALLNTRHMVYRLTVLSIGSLNSSIVHPREVFREAIRHAAASVLLVHNHPSGEPTPSEDDVEMTQRLARVGETVGIEVLDHVIIGGKSHFSFREAGIL
jgi:DNA repair protein RadC